MQHGVECKHTAIAVACDRGRFSEWPGPVSAIYVGFQVFSDPSQGLIASAPYFTIDFAV